MKEYYKKILYLAGLKVSDEQVEKISCIIDDANTIGGNVNIHMIVSLLRKWENKESNYEKNI